MKLVHEHMRWKALSMQILGMSLVAPTDPAGPRSHPESFYVPHGTWFMENLEEYWQHMAQLLLVYLQITPSQLWHLQCPMPREQRFHIAFQQAGVSLPISKNKDGNGLQLRWGQIR
jgi:hypothetical protein